MIAIYTEMRDEIKIVAEMRWSWWRTIQYTASQKKKLMLHTITSMQINRFW